MRRRSTVESGELESGRVERGRPVRSDELPPNGISTSGCFTLKVSQTSQQLSISALFKTAVSAQLSSADMTATDVGIVEQYLPWIW